MNSLAFLPVVCTLLTCQRQFSCSSFYFYGSLKKREKNRKKKYYKDTVYLSLSVYVLSFICETVCMSVCVCLGVFVCVCMYVCVCVCVLFFVVSGSESLEQYIFTEFYYSTSLKCD